MLAGGGKHKEGLLLNGHQHLIFVGAAALQIVDLALSEDEGLSLKSSLLEGDPPCHVFDVLHDEVHRNSIVPEPRDDNISINSSWQYEVPKRFLDELVVLVEHTQHASSSFRCISLQSPAESDIV